MPKEKNKKLNMRWPQMAMGALVVFLIVCLGIIVSLKSKKGLLEETEQFKASVAPKEDVSLEKEVSEIGEVEEERYVTSAVGTILKLEGTGNKRTDIFSVGSGQYAALFLIALDDFPSPDKTLFWKISLYRVGEENPRETYEGENSLDRLKNIGWTPSDRWAGGIADLLFEGLGEFYFEIEVKNVDSWSLKVTSDVS